MSARRLLVALATTALAAAGLVVVSLTATSSQAHAATSVPRFDQAAWFDNHTVMYAVGRGADHADVWWVPADGTGTPTVLVPDAESPGPLWSGS